MAEDLNDPVYSALVTARVTLLFNQPFFGNLATRMDLIDASNWCPSAATDGRRIYYNREFVKKLNKDEILFLLGHEVLHCVYDHLGRRNHRDPQIWNMANDYIINWTLVNERLGKMPKGGLYDERYTDDWASEEVYNDLMKRSVEVQMPLDMHLEMGDDDGDSQGNDGSGGKATVRVVPQSGKCPDCGGSGKQGGDQQDQQGSGSGGDQQDGQGSQQSGEGQGGGHNHGGEDCPTCGGSGQREDAGQDGPVEVTEEDLQRIRQEIKSATIQAAQAAGAGRTPAGVKRMIKELTEPKMDWRELLQMHIKSSIKDDYTWQSPSRKSWSCGAILPGMDVEDTIDVAIAVDVSGSISDEQLRDFLSEVKGIMDEFTDFTLRIWSFDTQVYSYTEFRADNIDEFLAWEPHGGGGTDFMCNWHFMKDPSKYGFRDVDEIEPHRFVMFTDGMPHGDWGDPHWCDTLFIIHDNPRAQAPFGLTAHYEDAPAKKS